MRTGCRGGWRGRADVTHHLDERRDARWVVDRLAREDQIRGDGRLCWLSSNRGASTLLALILFAPICT